MIIGCARLHSFCSHVTFNIHSISPSRHQVLDLLKIEWQRVTPTVQLPREMPPIGRYGHVMLGIPDLQTIIMFGGQSGLQRKNFSLSMKTSAEVATNFISGEMRMAANLLSVLLLSREKHFCIARRSLHGGSDAMAPMWLIFAHHRDLRSQQRNMGLECDKQQHRHPQCGEQRREVATATAAAAAAAATAMTLSIINACATSTPSSSSLYPQANHPGAH